MRGSTVGSLVLCFGLAGARAETPSVAALPVEKRTLPGNDSAANINRQIRLDVKIGELSITELRRQGINFAEIRNGQKQQDRKGMADFVAMLVRNKALKIVAEPSLVVAEGRQASFHSGPTVAGRKIGSQIQLTAQLLENDRVRIDLHAVQTDQEPLLSVATRGGIAPAFRTNETAKTFEMDLGKTMISGGMAQTLARSVVDPRTRRQSNAQVETQMLYIVTPQLVVPAE